MCVLYIILCYIIFDPIPFYHIILGHSLSYYITMQFAWRPGARPRQRQAAQTETKPSNINYMCINISRSLSLSLSLYLYVYIYIYIFIYIYIHINARVSPPVSSSTTLGKPRKETDTWFTETEAEEWNQPPISSSMALGARAQSLLLSLLVLLLSLCILLLPSLSLLPLLPFVAVPLSRRLNRHAGRHADLGRSRWSTIWRMTYVV